VTWLLYSGKLQSKLQTVLERLQKLLYNQRSSALKHECDRRRTPMAGEQNINRAGYLR
jgi:hypothetical protein